MRARSNRCKFRIQGILVTFSNLLGVCLAGGGLSLPAVCWSASPHTVAAPTDIGRGPAPVLPGALPVPEGGAAPVAKPDPVQERLSGDPRDPAITIGRAYQNEYRIGPSDTLEINVWGEPDLTRVVTVRPDGRITLPLVRDVDVNLLTPEEAADRIQEELKEYVIDPQVTVIVNSFSSSTYFLFGEVAAPGEYPLLKRTKVSEAVTRAGGFRQAERSNQVVETGDLSRLLLFRELPDGTRQTFQLDLSGYKDEGPEGDRARANDMLVMPGDQIAVPEKARVAYILGEVRGPGIAPLSERTTLLQALAERGGELPTADLRKVWVVRQQQGKTEYNHYDIKRVLRKGDMRDNIVLQPGDVVYVPKSVIGSVQEFVLLWTGTLQPAMSLYRESFDTWYTKERYDALKKTGFGSIIRQAPGRDDSGGRDF